MDDGGGATDAITVLEFSLIAGTVVVAVIATGATNRIGSSKEPRSLNAFRHHRLLQEHSTLCHRWFARSVELVVVVVVSAADMAHYSEQQLVAVVVVAWCQANFDEVVEQMETPAPTCQVAAEQEPVSPELSV